MPPKKTQKNKMNLMALTTLVALGLLLIVTVLTLADLASPTQLKTAATAPTPTPICRPKGKPIPYGPITGEVQTDNNLDTAKKKAFNYTIAKMELLWNQTDGYSTIRQADREIDCSIGQPQCGQQLGTVPTCTLQEMQMSDCTYAVSSKYSPFSVTATCTTKVPCTKKCTADPSTLPEPEITACGGELCAPEAKMISLEKTAIANGDNSNSKDEARDSAEKAAKAKIDCSNEGGGVDPARLTKDSCSLMPQDPFNYVVESSINCSTGFIKHPPVDINYQARSTCKYQCKTLWQCIREETPAPITLITKCDNSCQGSAGIRTNPTTITATGAEFPPNELAESMLDASKAARKKAQEACVKKGDEYGEEDLGGNCAILPATPTSCTAAGTYKSTEVKNPTEDGVWQHKAEGPYVCGCSWSCASWEGTPELEPTIPITEPSSTPSP